MNSNHTEQLYALWTQECYLEVGQRILERMPVQSQPAWAAELLSIVSSRCEEVPEVSNLIEIARHPTRWSEAHSCFGALRRLTLAAEQEKPSTKTNHLFLLYLAENIAKLTYNAGGYPAPFDPDSGWWIPQNLKHIIDQVNDPGFTSDVMAKLFR